MVLLVKETERKVFKKEKEKVGIYIELLKANYKSDRKWEFKKRSAFIGTLIYT